MTTFFVPTDGNWSGGGKAVLDNFRHAASRHPEISFEGGDIAIVNRNFPPRGAKGPFILIPQNAWPWAGPTIGLKERMKVRLLGRLTERSMRKALGVIRAGRGIPVRGNCWPHLLPNPLDEAFDVAEKESRGLQRPVEAPYIVSVGSLNSYRGVESLIAAYVGYRRSGGTAELHVIGRGVAHYVEKLREQAESVDGFHLHTDAVPRSEVVAWLRHAQAVVLPSHVETSPMSVLEALAVQPRVIASDIPGHPDIVPPGVAGPAYFSHVELGGLTRLLLKSDGPAPELVSPLADPTFRAAERDRWADELAAALNGLAGKGAHV